MNLPSAKLRKVNNLGLNSIGLLCALILLTSCDQKAPQSKVNFSLQFEKNPLVCDKPLTIEGNQWQLDQFQLFLSDIQLSDNSGQWHSASIKSERDAPITENQNPAVSKEVALIGVICPQQGEWSISLESDLELDEIKQIRFDVGVPFSLNHQNPMTLPAPLNQPDMFWTWQTGHKFLRLEMASKNRDFVYHLGSTGCASPSSVRAPKMTCKNPNRPTVLLENFDSTKPISINIDRLLSQSNLSSNVSCKSSPDNESCKSLLRRTGIGGEQKLFEVTN